MPSAPRFVLLHSLHTQQGVLRLFSQMTLRLIVKPAFPLRKKRSVETHALRLSGTKNLHFAIAPFPRFSAAEAAALLVLQKKFRALLGGEVE